MSQPAPSNLVTVNIDGRDLEVPKGTNIIDAAAKIGVEIPHYCYHPKLSVVGNCRMCLIEMGMPAVDPATKQPVMDPATNKQKINWIPRPQIGCATNASPGLHIRTNTPLVKECREGVSEFLLINHPLDCPICDQAGECRLQEFSMDYGRGYSRFTEKKNVKPKRTQLGPRVTLDDERCILCSRCIRFCKEIAKDDVLGFVDRGSYSTLTCYPGKELTNNYSLNTVDICPVGALTSTDFRFKMRVWFLKTTPSIDTESSVGANTELWSREGVIYRITPRQNDAVNDTWMADSGRVLYKQVTSENRLREARVDGHAVPVDQAIAAAATLLKNGGVAVVGSGRQSVEEQFLTAKLAKAANAASSAIVARVGKGDGLLISADRNPNLRGALVTGLIKDYPHSQLAELGAAIDAGRVKTVITFGEDLAEAGLTTGQLSKISLVYIGTHAKPSTAVAKIVIPTLTVFEKSGSLINQQFRLQKFYAAIPAAAGTTNDLVVLARLLESVSGNSTPSTPDAVWSVMAREVSVFAKLTWALIAPQGSVIDGAAWAALPFVEGESMHHKPVTAPKAAVAATPA